MAGIEGPAIFLAQFLRDEEPFDSLDNIAGWAADHTIQAAEAAFDDFPGAQADAGCDRRIPAIECVRMAPSLGPPGAEVRRSQPPLVGGMREAGRLTQNRWASYGGRS